MKIYFTNNSKYQVLNIENNQSSSVSLIYLLKNSENVV